MKLPKSICMLPWVSIETSPIGSVRPCCLAKEEIVDDNGNKFDLNNDNLETVYKSKYMQNLRTQFRNGEKPKTCQLCWDEEAAGRTSKRIHTKIRLKPFYDFVDWNNNLPDQLWFIDLKLGNICNLKCRICGSWSSSKWAAEELDYMPKNYNKKEHIAYKWLKQGTWPQNKESNFWENLKELLPHVKYMEFTGGEPWLIQEHFELLNFAVEQKLSGGIEIHYNTNGTQSILPHIELFSNFARVEIAYSIDNVGKRFEYERHGALWDEVNHNIEETTKLKKDLLNLQTQLCFTINVQNVYYIDELLEWAITKKFNDIFFNMLHNPKHMSIQHMTDEAKALVINKLESTHWRSSKFSDEIKKIVNFIKNGTGSDGKEFLERMQLADNYRKQNFKDTHPEIANAMGY